MARGKKVELSPEETEWLVANFPNMKNAELARHLGCGWRTVVRRARVLGLEKTESFMKETQHEGAAAACEYWKTHDIPEHVVAMSIERLKPWRYGNGRDWREGLSEEQISERNRKCSESRSETIRKEKRRLLFGLPQKTGLKVTRQCREKVNMRSSLRKLGYKIERGSYTVYVDGIDKRHKKKEMNATKYGFEFIEKQKNYAEH